jgi:hypothetical protein
LRAAAAILSAKHEPPNTTATGGRSAATGELISRAHEVHSYTGVP